MTNRPRQQWEKLEGKLYEKLWIVWISEYPNRKERRAKMKNPKQNNK